MGLGGGGVLLNQLMTETLHKWQNILENYKNNSETKILLSLVLALKINSRSANSCCRSNSLMRTMLAHGNYAEWCSVCTSVQQMIQSSTIRVPWVNAMFVDFNCPQLQKHQQITKSNWWRKITSNYTSFQFRKKSNLYWFLSKLIHVSDIFTEDRHYTYISCFPTSPDIIVDLCTVWPF